MLNDLEQRSDSKFNVNIIFIDSWFGDVHAGGLEGGPERDALVNAMRMLSSSFPSARLLIAIVPDHDCDIATKNSYTEEVEVHWPISSLI